MWFFLPTSHASPTTVAAFLHIQSSFIELEVVQPRTQSAPGNGACLLCPLLCSPFLGSCSLFTAPDKPALITTHSMGTCAHPSFRSSFIPTTGTMSTTQIFIVSSTGRLRLDSAAHQGHQKHRIFPSRGPHEYSVAHTVLWPQQLQGTHPTWQRTKGEQWVLHNTAGNIFHIILKLTCSHPSLARTSDIVAPNQ